MRPCGKTKSRQVDVQRKAAGDPPRGEDGPSAHSLEPKWLRDEIYSCILQE